ncbi:hypothetical protein KC19_10G042700 [Ceratodon purpureus]|uniref:CCR4-NOT transcription complex subunit 10 n=1 Tax=Ceratodon purpureus TaxID=3225 RepID=A0A8T0GJ72_CERPU|nr:hypothetical protein KC19_10G042700 [Ceratodon purpureus]
MDGDGDGSKEPPQPGAAASAAASEDTRPQSTVAGLAKEAAQLFHSRSYQGCLLILHQLQLHNDEDPKVRHNIAVAEYYRDGCTNPQKLLEVLSQVKARNEELARAAEEQQEGNSSASTSGSTNSTGGNGGLSSATRTNSVDVVAYMEDYDTSIPNLNNAMIMYHLQRYAAAMSILEPLYRNIEPIDEAAALRVCLLMLDITLASGQPGKAAEVLQYMEKAFGYLLPPTEASSTAPTLASSTPETESLIANTEQTLARTASDEVLEEDSFTLGSLEVDSSQNLGSRAPITPAIAAREKPIPPVDVKLLLHLYRVRLFLSARNLKASKREIKSALNLSRENMTALLLKAQLEYCRGNYRKAIKQLTLCIGRADPGMRGMLLSNLGCIHHRLRKDQTAALYFRKALQAFAISERREPLSVLGFSQDRSLSIIYNAGLQQLSCGNPILASRCFQEAAALYYNRPLLWLRLAECCIVALEKGLLENTTTTKSEVKVTVVGEGAWRRVVLPGGSLNPTVVNGALVLKVDESEGDVQIPDGGEKWFVSGKSHKLSLSFAIQCLQIATCLFDRCDAKAAEAAAEAAVALAEVKDADDTQSSKGGGASPKGEAKDTKSLVAAVAAIEEHKMHETAALRMWALAALSYCQLGVGHPLRALRSAEELLRQTSCARPYMLLGHMYAAEALCQLERPQEALEHLSTCLNETTAEPTNAGAEDESNLKWKSGDNSEASVDGEDGATYTVGALGDAASVARLTGTNARASLYINLVAVYAMQGNLQEAHRLAQLALTMSPANPTAMLAAVYVELKLERKESALTLLKQYRHLCVVSSSKGLSQYD